MSFKKSEKKSNTACEVDYTNNYIHTGRYPMYNIRNRTEPVEGYPKLQRLKQLKATQISEHSVKAYGSRVPTYKILNTLNEWISLNIQFDVIMIGALVENQLILPLLVLLPIHKLCSKPGFLFVWASTSKIAQLSSLLNSENWTKKFRRSEELVFIPVDSNSPFFPGHENSSSEALFEKKQWHCWMCITGTVRRATDSHLIHCNVDTDLQLESANVNSGNNVVPEMMYRVAENFSNSNRRLHIVPNTTGYNIPLKMRRGWVVLGPDVLVDNFSVEQYEKDLYAKSRVTYKSLPNQQPIPQYLVPQTDEIDELRPKSPV